MSPYERQIDPAEAVDVNFVLGVPGQSGPTAEETLEPVLYAPLVAQRLAPPASASVPSLDELLSDLGIERHRPGLGYDPDLGYESLADRDTEVQALLGDSGGHSAVTLSPSTGLDPRIGVGVGAAALALCLVPVLNILAALFAVGALVVGLVALQRSAGIHEEGARLSMITVALAVCAGLGAVGSMAAYGAADGSTATQIARGNGAATSEVLAQDLGVGLGTYAAGGLPVTLTNTAPRPLAYNITVEAVDAAGQRVTTDVAFVGTLAAGQSTVVTMFASAAGGTAAELAGSQFHVVEASAY